jgi:hypothetical protein
VANPYIDSWIEYGTRNPKTGKIPEYKISIREDGSFACSCPNWINMRDVKTDCKHILKRIIKLMQQGSPYVAGMGTISKQNKANLKPMSKPLLIKNQAEEVTRSISFEDI